MMASAAAELLFPSPATSSCIPFAIGSMESCCPITPVDATTTSPAATPVCRSTSAHISSAISTPFALQVFALPLLTMTACA